MADLTTSKTLVSIRNDGTPITIGFLENGTTYAPVRKLMEHFGFRVNWDEQENVVEIQK